jgi:hypothetical protein
MSRRDELAAFASSGREAFVLTERWIVTGVVLLAASMRPQ